MAATLGTRLYTWLRGVEVGRDSAGNRYFRAKSKRGVHNDSLRREKRWVIYNGEVEASRVPPEWHAWLHHTAVEPPPAEIPRRPWWKPHRANMTGTPEAYRPPGSLLQGGHRAPATGDYEAWRPE
jgi:NADH:ubiquinone oxidoreductase subunit